MAQGRNHLHLNRKCRAAGDSVQEWKPGLELTSDQAGERGLSEEQDSCQINPVMVPSCSKSPRFLLALSTPEASSYCPWTCAGASQLLHSRKSRGSTSLASASLTFQIFLDICRINPVPLL